MTLEEIKNSIVFRCKEIPDTTFVDVFGVLSVAASLQIDRSEPHYAKMLEHVKAAITESILSKLYEDRINELGEVICQFFKDDPHSYRERFERLMDLVERMMPQSKATKMKGRIVIDLMWPEGPRVVEAGFLKE